MKTVIKNGIKTPISELTQEEKDMVFMNTLMHIFLNEVNTGTRRSKAEIQTQLLTKNYIDGENDYSSYYDKLIEQLELINYPFKTVSNELKKINAARIVCEVEAINDVDLPLSNCECPPYAKHQVKQGETRLVSLLNVEGEKYWLLVNESYWIDITEQKLNDNFKYIKIETLYC